MAKATRLSMIVDRFISYNLERYRNDPTKLPLFTGLVEADLVFEDMLRAVKGARSSTIRSPTRNFVGYNQRWGGAEINNPNAFDLTEEALFPNEQTALNESTPGVYVYSTVTGVRIVILVPRATPVGERGQVAITMLTDSLLFDIERGDISIKGTDLVVNAPCMWGDVKFAPAADPIMQIGAKQYGQLTHPEDLVI